MKFRSKPVVIEARQFDGTVNSAVEIIKWAGDDCSKINYRLSEEKPPRCILLVISWEGTMGAVKGDWIIRGTVGEFYPCKPEVFEKKYERLEDSDAKRT